jgi:hypothetical protein
VLTKSLNRCSDPDDRSWHESEVRHAVAHVGYRGKTVKHLLVLSFTGFDPGADSPNSDDAEIGPRLLQRGHVEVSLGGLLLDITDPLRPRASCSRRKRCARSRREKPLCARSAISDG